MSEKIKPDDEENETNINQENLLLLNAWLDFIEIKQGKSVSKIVQDFIKKDSDQLNDK